jgi:hypothetical protein
MSCSNDDYNVLVQELNAIKRALGIRTYNDDISVYGRLSRVEDSASQNLQRLTTKQYIIDSIDLEITDSNNPIFVNGNLLERGVDYSIIDGTNIQFNIVPPTNTEIVELIGSFVQQNKLEFFYTTMDGVTDILEVSDTNNPIFFDGVNIQPSLYNVISAYQIQFLTPPINNVVVGELLGGGRHGVDGITPIKGVDYDDGSSGPVYIGEYDDLITYEKDNLVVHNSKVWILIVSSSLGIEPVDGSTWNVFVESGTMKYIEGSVFPPSIVDNLGSFFQLESGSMYVCTRNSGVISWVMIG